MLFNRKYYQQFLTVFISACLLVLTGCASSQNNSALSEYDELTPWLDNLTLFVEQSLKNHPSLQYQPIQLLQRDKQGVQYADSPLLKKVSSYLAQNVSINSHFNLLLFNKAKYESKHKNQYKKKHNNKCAEQQAKFYLTISFSQAARGEFNSVAEFTLVDTNTRQNLVSLSPKISYQQSLYLTGSHNQYLTNKKLNKNQHTILNQQVVYNLHEIEKTSKKIAYTFACKYQLSKHSDMVVFVSTKDERLRLIATEVNQQLARLFKSNNFTRVSVGNANNTNVQLRLTLYPNASNNSLLLLKIHPTLNTGTPLVDLSFDLKINKPAQAPEVEIDANIEAENTGDISNIDNSKPEQLIDYLFAVAPTNYQDCNNTNPWQFGEQILPNSVKLPHYGCFAIKMGLHDRANALLFTKTAEGHVYRIDIEQCANKSTSALFDVGFSVNSFPRNSFSRSSFPRNYAKEQLVLELNQHQGVEHIVYMASQYSWSNELLQAVEKLPLLCDEQTVYSSYSKPTLKQIINIAKQDKVDLQNVYIYH